MTPAAGRGVVLAVRSAALVARRSTAAVVRRGGITYLIGATIGVGIT